MARALPFPRHKHPPVRRSIFQAIGSAASQTAAAVGEDQGAPGEVESAPASSEAGDEEAPKGEG